MIKQVTKKTFYFDLGWVCIPFYKLNNTDIVILDCGLKKEGEQVLNCILENGFNPIAIIHSHIHDDHINGDLCFIDRFPIKIYGSMIDVDASYDEYNYIKDVPTLKEGDIKDMFIMCEYLEKHMIDTSLSSTVEISGEIFILIPTPGHSTDHKMIVTPDGVCYLGDVLMANNTLKRAKLPYTFHIIEDLESKKSVLNHRYEYYIAAHDGYFCEPEIEQVVRDNLEKFYGLIDKSKKIFNDNPDISKADASASLQKAIGLCKHIGVPWVLHTVDEVFDLINKGYRI